MYKITLNEWVIANQIFWMRLFGGTDTRADARVQSGSYYFHPGPKVSRSTTGLRPECWEEGCSQYPGQLSLPQVIDWLWMWLSHQPDANSRKRCPFDLNITIFDGSPRISLALDLKLLLSISSEHGYRVMTFSTWHNNRAIVGFYALGYPIRGRAWESPLWQK